MQNKRKTIDKIPSAGYYNNVRGYKGTVEGFLYSFLVYCF